MSASRGRGFTLIELLVVIAIIAILATWAVPSFSQLIARNTLDSQADRLWQAISAARLEAAERRTSVYLCPTDDAPSQAVQNCSNDWQDRWILFEDTDDDPANTNKLQATDTLIRHYTAGDGDIHISANSTLVNGIRYQPDGFTSEIGTITLCHAGLENNNAREIVVHQGRVRRTTANKDDC